MIEANLDVQPVQLGHKVWPTTFEIYPDEMALLLIERNENRPDYRGFRRYQTIFVSRNDTLAKYMEDMGPAEVFISPGLDIPGGDPALPEGQWLETVGSLREYADQFREWLTLQAHRREAPDLIADYHDDIDQGQRASKHISQFGPYHEVRRG